MERRRQDSRREGRRRAQATRAAENTTMGGATRRECVKIAKAKGRALPSRRAGKKAGCEPGGGSPAAGEGRRTASAATRPEGSSRRHRDAEERRRPRSTAPARAAAGRRTARGWTTPPRAPRGGPGRRRLEGTFATKRAGSRRRADRPDPDEQAASARLARRCAKRRRRSAVYAVQTSRRRPRAPSASTWKAAARQYAELGLALNQVLMDVSAAQNALAKTRAFDAEVGGRASLGRAAAARIAPRCSTSSPDRMNCNADAFYLSLRAHGRDVLLLLADFDVLNSASNMPRTVRV